MGFGESMKKEGAYRLEDGRIVRGEARSAMRHWYPAAAAGESAAAAEVRRRQREQRLSDEDESRRGPSFELMAPLFYVPFIAGLRFGLKGKLPPDRLNQVVLGTIGVGLLHAGSVMFSDSSTV